MSDIRDVEERERTEAELERKRNLDEQEGKAETLVHPSGVKRARETSDNQPEDDSMNCPRTVKRARGLSDHQAGDNGMGIISGENSCIAEPEEGRPDHASCGEDEDEDDDSCDDDLDDIDEYEELEMCNTVLLCILAYMVLEKY